MSDFFFRDNGKEPFFLDFHYIIVIVAFFIQQHFKIAIVAFFIQQLIEVFLLQMHYTLMVGVDDEDDDGDDADAYDVHLIASYHND